MITSRGRFHANKSGTYAAHETDHEKSIATERPQASVPKAVIGDTPMIPCTAPTRGFLSKGAGVFFRGVPCEIWGLLLH